MARIVPTGYYHPWHLAPRRDFSRLLLRRKVRGALLRLGRLRVMRRSAAVLPWSSLCRFPPVVCVELTNRCNLSCQMCHRSFMDRPAGDMDFGLFEALMEEMGGQRGTMLVLIGQGEPTVHPRFLDALRLAKTKGVERVLLQTNGMKLLELADELVDAGLDDLHVSMDGAEAATFEMIRLGSDADRVARGVEAVLASRAKAGSSKPAVALRFCTMPENFPEQDAFWERWQGVLGEDDEVRFDGLQEYVPAPLSPDAAEQPCGILWKRVFVRQDGGYAFCCNHLDNQLGIDANRRDLSLREMWRDRSLERLRRLHLLGRKAEIPSCSECPLMADTAPIGTDA